MSIRGEVGSVDTTAQFMLENGASKCAARWLERKDELILARKHKYIRQDAKERILRNAKRILEKGTSPDKLVFESLSALVESKGDVQVLDAGEGDQVLVFTIGLALVGKSEFIVYCSEESVAATKERVGQAAAKSLAGQAVAIVRECIPGDDNPLTALFEVAKHLRPPDVPPVCLLKL
jgi:hypothetical protein